MVASGDALVLRIEGSVLVLFDAGESALVDQETLFQFFVLGHGGRTDNGRFESRFQRRGFCFQSKEVVGGEFGIDCPS